MAPAGGGGSPGWRKRVLRALPLVAVWLGVAAGTALVLFLGSSRSVVLASHDAEVRPTLDQHAVVRTGPVLPDLRLPVDAVVGVDVQLGKTDVGSTRELVRRYGFIASQPEGQVAQVEAAVVDMAVAAGLRGAAVGLVPVGFWLALGARRRRQLLRGAVSPRGGAALVVLVLAVAAVWQPWRGERPRSPAAEWVPLAEYVGEAVPLPEQVAGVEVRADVTTNQTRRLIESAIDTYEKSAVFYDDAAQAAADLELREPGEDETVVVMVSDRHDNIGMDRVARAVGDAAGATAVFNGGDDTSSGESWEAFSLDSLTAAFGDVDQRWAVAGNHDHGDFVSDYLAGDGWEMLDGEVVDGPGGSTLLGVPDPRSSGLGNWRDETGLSFGEVGARLADAACAEDEPVGTILVHDANLARDALERGCVDLVVGGHLHVTVPPAPVEGENGRTGYTFTMGTTGGAAYAIAIGSKPRRDATISLITYADARPAGIQTVVLQTNGVFRVGDYRPLDLTPADEVAALAPRGGS